MKPAKLLPFVILCLMTTIPVLAQNYSGDQEEIDQILQYIKNFSQFYMDEDFESLANAYAPDGKILPPSADIIEGRAAIKKRWILPEGVDVLHHKITPTEIEVIGDRAYDVGYYEGKTKLADGTENSFEGKYVIVWHKIEGDWKIYLDIWNSRDS